MRPLQRPGSWVNSVLLRNVLDVLYLTGRGRHTAIQTANPKIAMPQRMSATMCVCRHHTMSVAPLTV